MKIDELIAVFRFKRDKKESSFYKGHNYLHKLCIFTYHPIFMEHNYKKDRFKATIINGNGTKKWREKYGTKDL